MVVVSQIDQFKTSKLVCSRSFAGFETCVIVAKIFQEEGSVYISLGNAHT